MMETAQVTSRLSKWPCRHKETWWWNEEVDEALRERKKVRKLEKKKNRQRHGRTARRVNKMQRVISLAKGKKQKECARNLNDPNHRIEIFRTAKQIAKERQDIIGSNCLKGLLRKVTVDDKGIKDSSKEYMEKLVNKENEWDDKISARDKEGAADIISINEAVAASKKMKRQSPRLVRAGSRNDTNHRGYCNSVDTGLM